MPDYFVKLAKYGIGRILIPLAVKQSAIDCHINLYLSLLFMKISSDFIAKLHKESVITPYTVIIRQRYSGNIYEDIKTL